MRKYSKLSKLLAVVLVSSLAFCGCGKSEKKTDDTQTSSSSETSESSEQSEQQEIITELDKYLIEEKIVPHVLYETLYNCKNFHYEKKLTDVDLDATTYAINKVSGDSDEYKVSVSYTLYNEFGYEVSNPMNENGIMYIIIEPSEYEDNEWEAYGHYDGDPDGIYSVDVDITQNLLQ